MDVFGSAARGTDFDPARAGVDPLVTYPPGHPATFATHLDLRDALADLLGRPVDLIMAGTVANPCIRARIERSRQKLYAA